MSVSNEITIVPIFLQPNSYLKFARCKILPGIVLATITTKLKIEIKSIKLSPMDTFTPSHVIHINRKEYLKGLSERIKEDISEVSKLYTIGLHDIAKQILISLILLGRIRFTVGGTYEMRARDQQHKNLRISSYGHYEIEKVSPNISAVLGSLLEGERIAPSSIRTVNMQLERYYRFTSYWTDRLALSLCHFWNALCTRYMDQAFIGLTTTLESLLSTKNSEITHTLAERIAILLGNNAEEKLKLYERVKSIYNIRSKLVHGSAFPKKGKQTYESLFVSAKQATVPLSEFESLVDLTIRITNKTLQTPEYLNIIQTRRREDKITKALDDYFTNILLH